MDDQYIWGNINKGEVESLRILHDKYYNQMWLWASNYLHNESVAEELVSDCFIKLWDQRKHIIIEKSLRSYLYLMLRNMIVSYIRKTKGKLEVGSERLPDIPDEDSINYYEFYAELYFAISKIPDQRRKILELAAFESLTYKEIASQLNISVNTVKTQMGRAYQFLKEELDPKNFIFLQFFNPKGIFHRETIDVFEKVDRASL